MDDGLTKHIHTHKDDFFAGETWRMKISDDIETDFPSGDDC